MLTKKHFVAFAKVLSDLRLALVQNGTNRQNDHFDYVYYSIVKMCERENSRFDEKKFRQAVFNNK